MELRHNKDLDNLEVKSQNSKLIECFQDAEITEPPVMEGKVRKRRKDFWTEENLTKLIRQRAETCGEKFGVGSFNVRAIKNQKRTKGERSAANLYDCCLRKQGIISLTKIFAKHNIELDFSEVNRGQIIEKLVEALTPDLIESYRNKPILQSDFWHQENIRMLIKKRALDCDKDFGLKSFMISDCKNQDEKDAKNLYSECKRKNSPQKIQKIFNDFQIDFRVSESTNGEIIAKLVEVLTPDLIEKYDSGLIGERNFWTKDSIKKLIEKVEKNSRGNFGITSFNVRNPINQLERDARNLYAECNRGARPKKLQKIFDDLKIDFKLTYKTKGEITAKLIEVLTPDLYDKFIEDKFWNESKIRSVVLERYRENQGDLKVESFRQRKKKNLNTNEKLARRLYAGCRKQGIKIVEKILSKHYPGVNINELSKDEIIKRLIFIYTPISSDKFKKINFWSEENLKALIKKRSVACKGNFGLDSFRIDVPTNQEERDANNLYSNCKLWNNPKNLDKIFESNGVEFKTNKATNGEIVEKLIEVLAPELLRKFLEHKTWQESKIRETIIDCAETSGDDFSISSFRKRTSKNPTYQNANKLYRSCIYHHKGAINSIINKFDSSFDIAKKGQGEIIEKLIEVLAPDFIEKFREDKFWNERNIKHIITDRAEECKEYFGIESFTRNSVGNNDLAKNARSLYGNCRKNLSKIDKIFKSRGVDFDVKNSGQGEIIEKLVEVLTPNLIEKYRENKFWNERNIKKILTEFANECGDQFGPSSFRLQEKNSQLAIDVSKLVDGCRRQYGFSNIQKILSSHDVIVDSDKHTAGDLIEKLVETLTPEFVENFRRDKFWNKENIEAIIRERAKTCGENFGIFSFRNRDKQKKTEAERNSANIYNNCKRVLSSKRLNEIFEEYGIEYDVSKKTRGEITQKLVQVLTPELYPKFIKTNQIAIKRGHIVQSAWECILSVVGMQKSVLIDNNFGSLEIKQANKSISYKRSEMRPDMNFFMFDKESNLFNDTIWEIKLQNTTNSIKRDKKNYAKLLSTAKTIGEQPGKRQLVFICLNGKSSINGRVQTLKKYPYVEIRYWDMLTFIKLLADNSKNQDMLDFIRGRENSEKLDAGQLLVIGRIANMLRKLKRLVSEEKNSLNDNLSLEEIDRHHKDLAQELSVLAKEGDYSKIYDSDVWDSLDGLM